MSHTGLLTAERLHQAETLADKRIVVAIDGWDTDSAYPSGHYVRTLGTIGDRCRLMSFLQESQSATRSAWEQLCMAFPFTAGYQCWTTFTANGWSSDLNRTKAYSDTCSLVVRLMQMSAPQT